MRDRTREIERRVAAARAAAGALAAERRRIFVAAETLMRSSRTLLAHAVPDIGDLSATKGLSLCERLCGDEVVVVPDLEWDQVPEPQRCPECERTLHAIR